MRTEDLVASLADEARPVRPLAPPLLRAAALAVIFALVFAGLVLAFGDWRGLIGRYAGREGWMIAEMAAMAATGLLALGGAFALSMPGGSRQWLTAPLPALALWIALSGLGCLRYLRGAGEAGWGWGAHPHCLVFILVAGTLVGLPILWRLSRARPIDPLPVALLGGLAAAALSALLLQFFHPFEVTVLDLAFHLLAVALLIGGAALLRRPALRPA